MPAPRIPLGVPLMDEDHARLEALMATAPAVADADLPIFAARLHRELTGHFAAEEKLMRERGAPVLECHIAQHRMLLAEVEAGVERAGADTDALRRHLGRDVPALVLAHVASVDQVAARVLAGTLAAQSVVGLRLPIGSAA